MAIVNLGDTIFFAHKIGQGGEYADHLGDMSLELAVWLESRYYDLKLAQQAKSDDNTLNITDPQVSYEKILSNNQDLMEMHDRSCLAGSKYYDPPLCTVTGQLVNNGLIKAEQAIDVIREINDRAGHDIAYNPNTWDDADDFFVKATIPIRSLKMLQVILKAINAAENRVREGKAPIYDTSDTAQEKEQKEQNEQKAQREQDALVPRAQRLSDFRAKVAEPDKDFNIVMLNVSHVPGMQVLKGFVPTALLRQKARTDLNYLFKYGLINLGAYRDGNIGRPKHIIFPAKPGIKVIDHLTRLGHLF